MNIKVLGFDLGKTVCSLAGLDEAEQSCFASACSGIDCWTFWMSFHPVLLRWKLAAAHITSGACVFRLATNLG